MQFFKNSSLYLAWLVALIATLVSLFYSEVKDWQPCTLCWYQRICLFPLVWLLGVAAFKRDHSVHLYIMPLVLLGVMFSLLQIIEEIFPTLFDAPLCGPGNRCSHHPVLWGFVSFPWLVIAAFLLQFFLLLVDMRLSVKSKNLH